MSMSPLQSRYVSYFPRKTFIWGDFPKHNYEHKTEKRKFKKKSFAWGTDLESIADKVFLESVDQETETLGTLKLK